MSYKERLPEVLDEYKLGLITIEQAKERVKHES